MAQLDANNAVRQTAFEVSYQESMRFEHLAEMELLRVRLTTIDNNADAQTRPSPRPTYFGGDPTLVKTLANVLDSKQVSNFSRNNQYLPHLNVCTQHENFVHMIASPFNSDLQYDSWESAIRGGDDMMEATT